MIDPAPLHATLAARFSGGAWRGVLLRGPSGVGKSALALALMQQGWRLAADDRVMVWASGGELWGRAPSALAGRLEVRGVGVLAVPSLPWTQVSAVVELQPEAPDRLPDPAEAELCGIALPLCRLEGGDLHAARRVAAFCDALCV